MKKATRPRREADPLVGEPPPRPERSVYDVAVLQKALDVLEIVADGPELGLSELSERSGASKASNYRILSTLESRGFLVKDPATRKYSPGPRLIAVAYGVIGRVDVVGMARPALEGVRTEFDETVNLGVLVDNQVLYVDILESAQALRMAARPGAKDPLHSTALGKAILSAMSTEDARSILKTYRRTAMTPHTLTSLEALVTELAVIPCAGIRDRQRGERARVAVRRRAAARPRRRDRRRHQRFRYRRGAGDRRDGRADRAPPARRPAGDRTGIRQRRTGRRPGGVNRAVRPGRRTRR